MVRNEEMVRRCRKIRNKELPNPRDSPRVVTNVGKRGGSNIASLGFRMKVEGLGLVPGARHIIPGDPGKGLGRQGQKK